MKRPLVLLLVPFLTIFFLGLKSEKPKEDPVKQIPDTIQRNIKLGVRAPQFPEGMDWLNVSAPVSLAGLKGKVVLLDFWTFCCINCMHVIPELKKLEQKYPNELVVIGVHSAKFDNEKDSENIRKSIMRYEIKHPVVNDNELAIWDLYAVHAWPTIVLMDTEGHIALQVSGEGNYEVLDQAVSELIRLGEKDGTLNRRPIEIKPESDQMETEILRFPGKVKAYADSGGLLVISDSNHNRILLSNLAGEILEIIGSGEEGRNDGSFGEASFNHPQGTLLSGKYIYVADTENHLLRRVDLENKIVETIAGTGQQKWKRFQQGKKEFKPLEIPLNSPWDLTMLGDNLYIAMAGAHQIWVFHLDKNTIEPFAGTGAESIQNGPFLKAAFSQPSGIASDGKNRLYVADSEVSAVRYLDLEKEQVGTLVGTGLFDFGDQDGDFNQALFQHGLGVDADENKIYFADTYNDKIKLIDIEDKKVTTLFGSGKEGNRDGSRKEAEFYEPGGISLLNNKIYVADTNNHKIRVANLKTGGVSTLNLRYQSSSAPVSKKERVDETVTLNPFRANAERNIPFSINVNLSGKYKFTPGAPLGIRVTDAGGIEKWKMKVNDPSKQFPIKGIIDISSTGTKQLDIFLDLYFCEKKDQSLCYFKSVKLIQPLEIEKSDTSNPEMQVNYQVS